MLSDLHRSAEEMAARHRQIGQSAIAAIRHELAAAYRQATEDPRKSLPAIEKALPEYAAFHAEVNRLVLTAIGGRVEAYPSELRRWLEEMGAILELTPKTLKAGVERYRNVTDYMIALEGGPAAFIANTRAQLTNGEGQLGALETLVKLVRAFLKTWLQADAPAAAVARSQPAGIPVETDMGDVRRLFAPLTERR